MDNMHRLLRDLNTMRSECFMIRDGKEPALGREIVAEVSAEGVEILIRNAPNSTIPLLNWKRSYAGDEDMISLLACLSSLCAGYMHMALNAVQEQRDRDAERKREQEQRVELRGHLDLRSCKAIAEVMIDFVDEYSEGDRWRDRKIELIKRIRALDSNVYKEG